jgi:1-acyl-sn-glycerol-3-phosphate acyltransferase
MMNQGNGIKNNRSERIARSVVFLMSIALTTVFFASVVLLEYIFTFWIKNKAYLHQVGVAWARCIIAMNRSWQVDSVGRENLPSPGQSVVYVANHLSQTDILAIFSLGMDFRWLSKDSVFRIPFLGWAMHAIGYVPVNRRSRSSQKRAIEISRNHLLAGTSMFFFPEGTRSPDGRLRRFKMGAFQLAAETNCSIVPIILVGTERLLPKGSITPGDASIVIRILPAVTKATEESIDAFAERSFRLMNDALPNHMRALE